MRRFLINVNGNSYEVEVEELTGSAGAHAGRPATAPASGQAAAPAAVAAPVTEEKSVQSSPQKIDVPAGATEVKSPLPGMVLGINVSVGDKVSKGDVLLIIEAMKMENEIMAPESGTVLSIAAARDLTVNTGDLLLVIG